MSGNAEQNQEPEQSDDPSAHRRRAIALTALVVLCVALIVFVLLYSDLRSRNYAHLAGYLAGSTIVITLAYMIVFARKQGIAFAIGAFVAIYASLAGSAYLVGLRVEEERKVEVATSVTALKGEVEKVRAASFDSNGVPQQITPLSDAPASKGESGVIEKYLRKQMNRSIATQNDYMHELDAIGWDKILGAERLKADPTFAESKIIMQRAVDLVAKYRARSIKGIEDARREIDTLDITDRQKEGMRAGFDSAVPKNIKRIETMWDMEAQVLAKIGDNITLLSTKRNKWSFQNDLITFVSQEDLDQFNANLAAVDKLSKEQMQMQQQNLGKLTTSLDKMNR